MGAVDPNLNTKEKQEAMDVAEAARETEWNHPSFAAELFMGRFRPELIAPFPEQSEADKKIGDEYLAKVEAFLRENVDPDEIDRKQEMPAKVIEGLVKLGCFGMKIPKEYGGMGFSQTNYNRVVSLVASYCGSTAVWLSAHQSICVPTPLKMFGTPEQKKKYLPLLANGSISGFALTEPGVGSDPAKMGTTAVPTEDGKHYIINGEKLWCTNGPDAHILIVMARTPSIVVKGKERTQITAFIVDTKSPGFSIKHRCKFMGLKGISNGLLKFENVKVPAENILWGLGNGLKLALITLNTGRLTLPAASAGMAKQCLLIARRWANERVQWGAPVGKHEAVANKLAFIASNTFAMEAVTEYASELAGRGGADIRLEAAMAKMFNSEAGWRVIDETVQTRGGRGYETADSLRGRGEVGYPVERMMRDARINTIIEGTSEIMRLFLAREALDPHMRIAGPLLNARSPMSAKMSAGLKATAFYGWWYPSRFFVFSPAPKHEGTFGPLAKHMRYVERKAAKLARSVFGQIMKDIPNVIGGKGPQLEYRQLLLGRFVEVGVELFAMSAVCAKAVALAKKDPNNRTPIELADYFCRDAKFRIAEKFRRVSDHLDFESREIAKKVLEEKYAWLEDGIVPASKPSAHVEKVRPSVPAPDQKKTAPK